MKNNNHQKSNKLSSSSGTSQNANLKSPDSNESPLNDSDKLLKPSIGAVLFQQGYMRRKNIKKILKEEERKKMDEYLSKQLDSLQVQINALRTRIDQLNTRLTSHLNQKKHNGVYEE